MMKKLVAADGHEFDCWMDTAEGTRKGGLVLIQEIFGITDQMKGVAQRYAAQGYDVAIPALFDRQQRGAVVPFDAPAPGRDMMLAADLDQTMMDIDAAVQALGGRPAVIGFCWGGGLAIRAAQKLNVCCAVSFYGTRLPQYLDAPLKAPVQGHFGKTDDHVPPEMLQQAQDFFDTFEVFFYDAGHAFANDARPANYVPDAADQAHSRAAEFIAAHIG